MSSSPAVDIVLATYNGGRYLDEQLASISAQTHSAWRLLVRDDGSTDDTLNKIHRFARSHAGRVVVIEDACGRLGVTGNFDALLADTEAPYVALCDQDDVWLPRKLELLLDRATAARGPVLVHGDLTVVDERLRLIHPSFWHHQRVDVAGGSTLPRLLLSNIAVGAATVVNRALLDLALPIPRQAVMHDWWLALVASAFGTLNAVPIATVLYRQHDRNAAGAQRYTPLPMRRGRMRETIARTQEQARAFALRYRDQLSADDAEIAGSYGALASLGPLARRAFLLRAGIHYRELARNLLLFALT